DRRYRWPRLTARALRSSVAYEFRRSRQARRGREIKVSRRNHPDGLAGANADRGSDLAVLLERRCGGVLAATEDDRSSAARDGRQASDHRKQHGRTKPLKEVGVDLAWNAAAAVVGGAGRSERHRHPVG